MLSEELAGKSLEVWKKKEILKKARVKHPSLLDSLKKLNLFQIPAFWFIKQAFPFQFFY